ncbi:MAG: electron transfer flavoprotein subunit alpha/FixB family protein [Longimicrobiales bacterium]
MARILAVAEQREGKLRKVSEEVVTAARTMAESVTAEVDALLFGPGGTAGVASALGRFGADRILVSESDEFTSPDVATQLIHDVAQAGDYFAVLFPATAQGKDLAPRVAARLDLPLVSDCIAFAVENGELVITRPVYSGRAYARVLLQASPRMLSIRPNVIRPQERAAAGTVASVSAPHTAPRVRVRELKAAAGARLDVGEATIVVSGGRGLKGPENWHLLEALRDALGPACALGASRAVVDAGWRPHAEQVGQTGKTVSPQLYFAIGISGAMQHLAGMRSAKRIVAINKDPDAPIFKIADYGLVGDVTEILPRLTDEIRNAGH